MGVDSFGGNLGKRRSRTATAAPPTGRLQDELVSIPFFAVFEGEDAEYRVAMGVLHAG
jgi:hypothetical protein